MAKLSTLRVDSRAIDQGEWMALDDDVLPGAEVLTRGYTDAYSDSRSAKLRRAATMYHGDSAKIPAATTRSIVVEALIDHCLIDVRGLTDDNDQPLSFGQFCDFLRSPDYPELLTFVIRAVGLVGRAKAETLEDAKKN